MTFANVQVDLESLPQSAAVDFSELDPRYARVALGVGLAVMFPGLILVTIVIFAVLVPEADLPLAVAAGIYGAILALIAFLAWFTYMSARVRRYALRQHDVIVHSGIFWQRQTVQPIRRIQHVEQHQGPVDKRFGLYELKLFSAGTGHFTFRIPGLDSAAASRIRRFILAVQQDGWDDDAAGSPAAGSGVVGNRADSGDEGAAGNATRATGAAQAQEAAADDERHD